MPSFELHIFSTFLCLKDCRVNGGSKIRLGVEIRDPTQLEIENIGT